MVDDAEDALHKIRDAIAADQVEITAHFDQRIGERGMLWTDVLTLFDQPARMEDQGPEVHGWPKWRIWGKAADGTPAGVVVALREAGRVRFIMIHWEE